MSKRSVCRIVLIWFFTSLLLPTAYSQRQTEQGHSIGKVSIKDDLIVLELNDGALGRSNLFDLAGRTLRFIPDGPRYRIENQALQWDSDFGQVLTGGEVTLHQFAFPFSSQQWSVFFVDTTGSISFGGKEKADNSDSTGRGGRGVSIGRFDALSEAANRLIDSAPAICVFLKPRMSGSRYVKELKDRVVITWDLTEPFGNIQDFTWFKTINRFQAVLYQDGRIEMSYQELAAKDAIVGVYPVLSDAEKPLATLNADAHPDLPAHLDVRSVKLTTQDDILLKVAFHTRGSILAEGDAKLEGVIYSVFINKDQSGNSHSDPTVWTIRGVARRGNPSRYFVFGRGVSRIVKTSGDTITIQGVLPNELRGAKDLALYAEIWRPGDSSAPAEHLPPQVVHVSSIHNPEVHLSSLTRKSGSFAMAYESFHYLALPKDQDLSCSVIQALDDKFDFLAYYSDFRVDNQEAGTPSNGAVGGNVTGIGQPQDDLGKYCTQGRFQWQFVQPVYVGSNQMQKEPPKNAPIGSEHDITFYTQTAEKNFGHKLPPYNYAMSQLGHEMGHRWAAFASAKVNGEEIVLGPVHWARGLQAQVKFPYQRTVEASAMGGGVWQENPDHTYTQLDDDYYVPATGYSYLDLYLMGLITPEYVPDFFILKNLVPVGKDTGGHPIFKADKIKITIQDVIAAEGPRLPDVAHSQKKFNTGIVVVVEYGKIPSPELLERANDIRQQWIQYWEITTGHLSSMTASPH